MHHEASLIATVAMGFVLAFAFGFLAIRLRLPPLIGYLVAGIAVGPFTPGFVADLTLAGQLAEIGVILLMFGVGLLFSAADLMAVRWIALPGAICQIVLATLLGGAIAMGWGWSVGAALVFGLSCRLPVQSCYSVRLRTETLSPVQTAGSPWDGSSSRT